MKIIKYLGLAAGVCLISVSGTGCSAETVVYECSTQSNTEDEENGLTAAKSREESEGKAGESLALPKEQESGKEAAPGGDMPKTEIVAYICGAVVSPGVYTLPEGSRVYELIGAAGGLLETADERSLNQAEMLSDGQQITVYTKEEAESLPQTNAGGTLPDSAADSGKVNLNTADIQQLTTLSGIGEARAQAIIAYRERHGGFRSVEEIMEIEGIKEKLFEKIREQIEI